MSAAEAFIPVEPGKITRRLAGHKILHGLIALISQASAHNLLYLSVMNINTWPEFHLCLLLSRVSKYFHTEYFNAGCT